MSTTPNLLISHIAASQNNKEVTANTAFDDFDGALTSAYTVAFLDANYTPTAAQCHYNAVFLCTGANTAVRKLIVPNTEKFYLVKNNTTGGYGINVIPATGTGVVIGQSDGYVLLYCDGTNVNLIGTFSGQGASANYLNQFAPIITEPSTNNTLYAVPTGQGGLYVVYYHAKIVALDTVSCSLGGTNGFQVEYTDADDSTALTTPAGPTSSVNALTTVVRGIIIVNAAGGSNIQFTFDYTTGSGGPSTYPMEYDLHVRVKKL